MSVSAGDNVTEDVLPMEFMLPPEVEVPGTKDIRQATGFCFVQSNFFSKPMERDQPNQQHEIEGTGKELETIFRVIE